MVDNDLPITGPGVHYATVEPIHQRELVACVNMFLIRTCTFMNAFATKCESKLARLNMRLKSLDTSIALLEIKLNSVDELRNIKLSDESAVQPPPPTAVQSSQPPQPTATNTTPASITNVTVPTSQVTSPTQTTVETPEPSAPANPISQDPRYSKYFKMFKMGVAEEAVKLKMKVEGLDPQLLNDPNAPAPPADENSESSSDSD